MLLLRRRPLPRRSFLQKRPIDSIRPVSNVSGDSDASDGGLFSYAQDSTPRIIYTSSKTPKNVTSQHRRRRLLDYRWESRTSGFDPSYPRRALVGSLQASHDKKRVKPGTRTRRILVPFLQYCEVAKELWSVTKGLYETTPIYKPRESIAAFLSRLDTDAQELFSGQPKPLFIYEHRRKQIYAYLKGARDSTKTEPFDRPSTSDGVDLYDELFADRSSRVGQAARRVRERDIASSKPTQSIGELLRRTVLPPPSPSVIALEDRVIQTCRDAERISIEAFKGLDAIAFTLSKLPGSELESGTAGESADLKTQSVSQPGATGGSSLPGNSEHGTSVHELRAEVVSLKEDLRNLQMMMREWASSTRSENTQSTKAQESQSMPTSTGSTIGDDRTGREVDSTTFHAGIQPQDLDSNDRLFSSHGNAQRCSSRKDALPTTEDAAFFGRSSPNQQGGGQTKHTGMSGRASSHYRAENTKNLQRLEKPVASAHQDLFDQLFTPLEQQDVSGRQGVPVKEDFKTDPILAFSDRDKSSNVEPTYSAPPASAWGGQAFANSSTADRSEATSKADQEQDRPSSQDGKGSLIPDISPPTRKRSLRPSEFVRPILDPLIRYVDEALKRGEEVVQGRAHAMRLDDGVQDFSTATKSRHSMRKEEPRGGSSSLNESAHSANKPAWRSHTFDGTSTWKRSPDRDPSSSEPDSFEALPRSVKIASGETLSIDKEVSSGESLSHADIEPSLQPIAESSQDVDQEPSLLIAPKTDQSGSMGKLRSLLSQKDPSKESLPQFEDLNRGVGLFRSERLIWDDSPNACREGPIVLQLFGASLSLSEADFRLIEPQPQMIITRDPDTNERLPCYILIFTSTTAAKQYQDRAFYMNYRVKQYHRNFSSSSPSPEIMPPPGYIDGNNDDMYNLLQRYTLTPPYQDIRLVAKIPPFTAPFQQMLEKTVSRKTALLNGQAPFEVRFYVDDADVLQPTLEDIQSLLRQDRNRRGAPWALASKIRSEDGTENGNGNGKGSNEEDDGEDDFQVKQKTRIKKGTRRFYLSFNEELEAKRFVRAWHRKPFPFVAREEGKTWELRGMAPKVNVEQLW